MAKIIPEGAVVATEPVKLEVTTAKKVTLVAKAKELLNGDILEEKVLMDRLEQFYVESNKHYTSSQLKDVIDQVKVDLAPEEEPVKA